MKLKIKFHSFVVYFDVLGSRMSIEQRELLNNILESLEGAKLINKSQPFDDLVRQRQQHAKHILVEFDPQPCDEFKLISLVVYNFLKATNQVKEFMLDKIIFELDDCDIMIYMSESLRQRLADATFSPTIRAVWTNPVLAEKIIKFV